MRKIFTTFLLLSVTFGLIYYYFQKDENNEEKIHISTSKNHSIVNTKQSITFHGDINHNQEENTSNKIELKTDLKDHTEVTEIKKKSDKFEKNLYQKNYIDQILLDQIIKLYDVSGNKQEAVNFLTNLDIEFLSKSAANSIAIFLKNNNLTTESQIYFDLVNELKKEEDTFNNLFSNLRDISPQELVSRYQEAISFEKNSETKDSMRIARLKLLEQNLAELLTEMN